MDPRLSAQDVLRCDLCETPVPPMYCDICKLNLCKPCVGEHLSDESTEHKVVPSKKRGSTLYCTKHSTKLCYLHCDQCDVPICVQCVSSGEHLGHQQNDILKFLENKNEDLQRDLKDLENLIYPKYQEIASNISVQKADLSENTKKLKTALDKQGENLHREIDNAIKKLKTDVDETESKYLSALDKQEDEFKRNISEITQIIADVKKLLNSNDVNRVSSYKSSIAKFIKLPSKLTVALPSLSPQKINKQQIFQQFGSLSAESISPDEYDDTSDSLRTLSYYLDKTQLSEEHEMDHLQRMSQRHLYQDNQHANKKHSMVGQRTGNFSKQELNDTRKDRMGFKKKNKGLRPLSSGLRPLSSNSTKELRPLSSGLSSNSTNSTKGLRPLSSNSTYAQVPARHLSRSYSDSTTGTDAVNVNRFAENAKKRFNRHSKEHDNQPFECPQCNQTCPDIDTLQIHVLDCFDLDMP